MPMMQVGFVVVAVLDLVMPMGMRVHDGRIDTIVLMVMITTLVAPSWLKSALARQQALSKSP